jgi:hypothetical protein
MMVRLVHMGHLRRRMVVARLVVVHGTARLHRENIWSLNIVSLRGLDSFRGHSSVIVSLLHHLRVLWVVVLSYTTSMCGIHSVRLLRYLRRTCVAKVRGQNDGRRRVGNRNGNRKTTTKEKKVGQKRHSASMPYLKHYESRKHMTMCREIYIRARGADMLIRSDGFGRAKEASRAPKSRVCPAWSGRNFVAKNVMDEAGLERKSVVSQQSAQVGIFGQFRGIPNRTSRHKGHTKKRHCAP